MSISDTTALVGLVLGALSMVSGFILWYKGSVEKRYAAERDFNHIRRNQEQLISNLNEISRDFEQRLESLHSDLKEAKAYSFSMSQRFDIILARLDSQSGLFGSRRKSED